MMAVFYSFLTLVLCLLTGGGNDLLDYVPTEAYWREKKVEVSLDTMVAELKERPGEDVSKLIADLGSPDAETRDNAVVKIREVGGTSSMKPLAEAADSPDAEVRRRAKVLLRQMGGDQIQRGVRRLMAIRTLGELGKPEAIPTLKPLLQSNELFEADYAQVAIDLIEGKAPAANAVRKVAPGVADDVWLLPSECQTVGQLVPRRGTPIGIAEFMAAMKPTDAQRKDADTEGAAHMVLTLAELIGNVRIDAVTFGVVGTLVDFSDPASAGYVAVIIRGKYHSEWARMLARAENVPVKKTGPNGDGIDVFQPDGEQAWLVPNNDVFVFLASPTAGSLPVADMAQAVTSGKGSLAADPAAHKLIESMDTKQVLWAASTVSDKQRALPVVGAFDTMTLTGTREGKTLKLKLAARGHDAKEVADAGKQVDKHAKEAAEFLAGIHEPIILMSADLLKSVKTNVKDKTLTLTAKLETTPAAILSLPALYDEGPEPLPPPTNPRLRE